ncbi:alpha/beta hydrolase [Hoyosella rhizosphaerae]|uniref:Thioesterase domain-containing protein n=1 Tax=Hoyosella rhizosphaerae TaxID=1755582 RepID=A0A916TZL8_9ACTN|nr:alpha/beta hydrolase [Hoyosella rhizosphaerae]MBN4927093.1 alpha/beta hydrolase [Hoyosella rhizosphaerae]GGC54112.1 hypothetical protein GCM10011410_03040 [Hoyosella rhizosphaerae]
METIDAELSAAYRTFRDEITQYVVTTDRKTGDKYRFYLLNQQYHHVQPVVIYNGFGSTPNTSLGQQYLWSYARNLDRPIIAPMAAHVHRRTHRRIFADGHARALKRVHPEPVHVAGMSWGGLLAFSVAETLQEQASHLVTMSSVGTLEYLTHYAYRAYRMYQYEGPVIRQAARMLAQDFDPTDREHPAPTMDPLSKLRRSLIMRRRSLPGIAYTLNSATTWHDIVGAHDQFAHYSDHIDTVLRRNSLHPKSSSITLVRNHGHMWAHMREPLAQLLAQSLRNKETDHYREATIARTRDDYTGVDEHDMYSVRGGPSRR